MAPENIYTYISKTCSCRRACKVHFYTSNLSERRKAQDRMKYFLCRSSEAILALQVSVSGASPGFFKWLKRRRPRTRQRCPTGNQNICSERNAVALVALHRRLKIVKYSFNVKQSGETNIYSVLKKKS